MEGVKRRKRISYIAAITLAVIMAIAGSMVFIFTADISGNKLSKKATENLPDINPTARPMWDYSYTGNAQTFTVPVSGRYQIETWGASGGAGMIICPQNGGGNGSYSAGEITLTSSTILYIHVGGVGRDAEANTIAVTLPGGYNGGGAAWSNTSTALYLGASGGGATDIRTESGAWNGLGSLSSRIMIAAGGAGGGSGGNAPRASTGGNGGGLNGGKGVAYAEMQVTGLGEGGTQTSGGAAGVGISMVSATAGTFGVAGNGAMTSSGGTGSAGGGGGGYYGGGGGNNGTENSEQAAGGGGGSSFISGHSGCNAISGRITSGTPTHSNQPNHY